MKSGEGVTSARQSISEGTIRLLREPPTRGFTELWNHIATKVMERAIGEIFDFNGVKLQVKDTGHEASCNGCYFNRSICTNNKKHSINQTGECFQPGRTDDRNVIFVEVENDQN